MKSGCLLAGLILMIANSQISPALAGSTSHTRYDYFQVHGRSLPALHADMARRGPAANGLRGYGATSASAGRSMTIAACQRTGAMHMDVNFVIKLPRAADTSALSGSEMALWSRFAQFVRRHEETHRTIWMGCIAEFDRVLQASGFEGCAAQHAKANALWQQMLTSCQPKQIAFDQQQQGALRRSPFYRQATR